MYLFITGNFARIELWINKGVKEENKQIFDKISSYKDQIESKFGNELDWHRLDDGKGSRVVFYLRDISIFNEEDWDRMIEFMVNNMVNFEKAMKSILIEVMKAGSTNGGVHMKISKTEIEAARKWMYRNARPIDLARWQYHFENGSKEVVLKALSAYQNDDGGFGYALEADSWNPNSSPIQTWCATEVILEIGDIEKTHPSIQGILRYLDSCKDFSEGYWIAEIPSNNDFPHAPWWSYGESVIEEWGYNPTACLAGFILFYADSSLSIYKKAEIIAKTAVDKYLSGELLNDMHESLCFIRLMEYCDRANKRDLFDITMLKTKLQNQVSKLLTRDTEQWKTSYVCKPSQFLNSPRSPFYEENRDLVEYEITYIIETKNESGVWDITWKWGMYEKEFAISESWWKANLVIVNMLFLRGFDCL